jgi:tetratricopeptide (TPR) repeat protein
VARVVRAARGCGLKREHNVNRSPAISHSPPNLQDLLLRGMDLHQAGRLSEARELYEEVLRMRPGFPPALHAMGLLAVAEARFADGIAHYRACLSAEPAFAAAWTNLGNAFLATGRPEEAVEAHRRAIALEPRLAEAHCNLGNALQALGLSDDAAASLARAVALKPELAEAHNNLGNVLKSQGLLGQAIAAYRRALEARPNYSDAWYNLGNTLLASRQPAEAESAFSRALLISPRNAEAHNNRGQALKELGRPDEALDACKKAIALNPAYAGAYTNLGNIMQTAQRWEEAIAAHRRALELQGDLVEAWSNLGNALMALNRTGEALAAYRSALRLRPDSAEIAYNECLVHLLQGEIPAAWEGYELRWGLGSLRRRPVQTRPPWSGNEPLEGRSIVVFSEQGFGDTLQFARYIPLLAERGAAVHAVVQDPLKSLVGRIRGVRSVGTPGEPWPECDFHCPLVSLPRAFRTALASIPSGVPYVIARPDRIEAAAGWLAPAGSPRVGVVWSGNPSHPNDRNRSLPVAALASVLTVSGRRWVSLQKELRPGEQEIIHAAGAVDLSGQLNDFEDTAGAISQLDLVITVDTAVAHLAGAMGVTTWILLPFAPDWRWLLERDDSPWYPTARLFRQSKPGNWDSVLARVAGELKNRPAAKT